MHRKLLAAILAIILLSPAALAADVPWIARGTAGMVASDSPEASEIGAAVLSAGGNAFDAVVATSFALAVARPFSTGMGGGGFMVAYVADERRFVALDFREMAPAAATPARYARLSRERGEGPFPSVYGGNAIGVPGQVAGLAEIRNRYGTRPWPKLIAPALTLADTGFVADDAFRKACQGALEDFEKWPDFKQQYRRLYETLLGAGTPTAVGDKVRRPDLARALRHLAEHGPDAFYSGPIAAAITKSVRAAGGELTLEDLRGYRVIERNPLHIRTSTLEIVTMPPPSSGGVCLVETLNILDCMAGDFGGLRPLEQGGLYYPALVYALKHAFADRARWLGDPDFAQIPVARLTSPQYAAGLAMRLSKQPEDFGSTQLPDDGGTSHFSIVDRHGNIVALTETINGHFGSLVVAEPFGIILNNEMDDFLTVPGEANLFGLQQGRPNLVGPGKRPLSSMTPTIVLKGGRPVLTLGGSGGPRIITAVTQVLLNVVELGQPLKEALAAARLHHQWQPDRVYFDRAPPAEQIAALCAAGETISEKRKSAAVQAIQLLPDGTLVGASDPRKGGRPATAR